RKIFDTTPCVVNMKVEPRAGIYFMFTDFRPAATPSTYFFPLARDSISCDLSCGFYPPSKLFFHLH
ncbi:MAG TPA: hypothetical protein PK198_20890, partial [Saprospiraceae bacterium]|nr:hypothetical protein [Saprospiraceae bacterium]